MEKVKFLFPEKIFKTIITRSSHIQEDPLHGQSVLNFSFNSRGSKEYRNLAKEILENNLIKMRVWERGSGETFACGTGSCAAVVAGVSNNLIKRDVKVLLRGGELDINWDKKTNNIYMKGMATKVYDGIMEI